MADFPIFRIHTTDGKFDVQAKTVDDAKKHVKTNYPGIIVVKVKRVKEAS